MTVSILSGRVVAVGDYAPDGGGFAPVRSQIRIGNAVVQNVHVPPEAEAFLVPGQQVTLHLAGQAEKTLFAIETGSALYDFTAAMVAKAGRERAQALTVLAILLGLSGAMVIGLVVWPILLAVLFGVLHVLHVPAVGEMRAHVRSFLADHPLTRLIDTARGTPA
jgi:hypothetical protein